MDTFFPQNNWEPFVYQRLNHLIQHYQQAGGTPLADQAYVVFDFDNTSAIADVEDNLMIYMLKQLLYKLTPEQFFTILTTGPFDFDLILEADRPNLTPANLAKDIIENYTWLYEHYIKAPQLSLEEVKATDFYQDFRAKLRYYYKAVNKHFIREAGQPWLTYWFQGYSQTELINLTREMLDHALVAPIELEVYHSSSQRPGIVGEVVADFTSGLRFPKELRDLYEVFQSHNIATYVVSASPIDVVRTAALEYGFQVPFNQVIAMCYQIDQDRKIMAYMEDNTFITKQAGKTAAIQQLIAPQHQGKQPIALFGDSMGDYDMMMNLQDVKLNVLFNCLLSDDTRSIVELAHGLIHRPDAQFVVQGRDENTGQLRPSNKSIAYGESQERLMIN